LNFDFARQRSVCRAAIAMEAAMYEAWFSRPVPVAAGISGEINNLSSANQAVDLLSKHWRSAGSQKHLAALRACRQAMNGGIAADAAIVGRRGQRGAHAGRISLGLRRERHRRRRPMIGPFRIGRERR